MPKLTLFDLSSGSFTVDLLNANFALIEGALEGTLSLNGTTPNSMGANFDMNSYRILNLPSAVSSSEPVTLGQLTAMSTLVLYTPSNHAHLWADISDKPVSFVPAAHVHAKADVTSLVTDLAALDTRLDVLEIEPKVWVQAGTPTQAAGREDLWFW